MQAQFYNNKTVSGTVVASRVDPSVNFNYYSGPPTFGVNARDWSVRWTGTLTPPTSGTYTLHLTSDDGSRLYINGALVIDSWSDHAENTVSTSYAFNAGQSYNVEVHYYNVYGASLIRLGWTPPGYDPVRRRHHGREPVRHGGGGRGTDLGRR